MEETNIRSFQQIVLIPYVCEKAVSGLYSEISDEIDCIDGVQDLSLYMKYIRTIMNRKNVCRVFRVNCSLFRDSTNIKWEKLSSQNTKSVITNRLKVNNCFVVHYNTGVNFLVLDMNISGQRTIDECISFSRMLRFHIENRVEKNSQITLSNGDDIISLNDWINSVIPAEAVREIILSPKKNHDITTGECIIISKLHHASTEDRDTSADIYRLANGVDSSFMFVKDLDHYGYETISEYPYIKWGMCLKGACCFVSDTDNAATNSFLENVFCDPLRFSSNYLTIFLLALHKKYALVNFLNRFVEFEKNGDNYDYDQIKKWRRELMDFNIESSYLCISDERTYQCLYDKFCGILSVNEAQAEIQSMLDELSVIEKEETENREKRKSEKTENLLNSIAVLGIFSALCDSFDVAGKWFTDTEYKNEPIYVIVLQVIFALIILPVIINVIKNAIASIISFFKKKFKPTNR